MLRCAAGMALILNAMKNPTNVGTKKHLQVIDAVCCPGLRAYIPYSSTNSPVLIGSSIARYP